MKEKLEYTLIGCGFSLLNCYMTQNSYPIVGIGFGLVAVVFFVKALRIKR
jgi:hypothetical protein